MLKNNFKRKLTIGVLAWAAAAIFSQMLIALIGIQYDASGIAGVFWWVTQLLLIPVSLLSEILTALGMPANGLVAHIIFTIATGLSLCLLIRLIPVNERLR